MSRKHMIIDVFHNQPVKHIPVGFWFHFLPDEVHDHGLEHPEALVKNLSGHRKYIEEFDPDFVKMMGDGLFVRPYSEMPAIEKPEDFYQIKPLPQDHPYFLESLKMAKQVREIAGEDRLVLFSVFAPMFHWSRFFTNGVENNCKMHEMMQQDPDAVRYGLSVVAQDLEHLIRLVMTEGGMDGIYLSVNNCQRLIEPELYEKVVAPEEIRLLNVANEYGDNQMLHICGWRGRQNILSCYQNYPAAVFNWSVHEEGLSLAKGKAYFGNKCILGGYDQMPGGLLNVGSKEEIQKFARDLIQEFVDENGSINGFMIGADCTVPSDTPIEHLQWVREVADEYVAGLN